MEENKENKTNMTAKKQLGITMIVVSCVLLFLTTFNFLYDVKAFMLGVFGIMLYPILLFTLLFGVAFAMGKRFVYSIKYVFYILLCFFFLMCVLHICFTGFTGSSQMAYGEYLLSCYHSMYTPGGLLVGVFTYPLMSLLHAVAGIVIYSIALVISLYFVFSYIDAIKQRQMRKNVRPEYKDYKEFSSEGNVKLFDEEPVLVEPEETLSEEIEPVETQEVNNDNNNDIFIKDEESKEVLMAKEKLGLAKKPEIEEQKEIIKTPSDLLFGRQEKSENWQNRGVSNDKPQKFVFEKEKPIKKQNPLFEKNKEYLRTIQDRNNINENPIINAEDYEDYEAKMRLFKERNTHMLKREDYNDPIMRNNPPQVKEPDEEVLSSNNFGIEPEKNFGIENVENDLDLDDNFIKPDNIFNQKISPLNPNNFNSVVEPELNQTKFEGSSENLSEKFIQEGHNAGTPEESVVSDSLGNTINLHTTQRSFNFNVLNGGNNIQNDKPVEPNFRYDSAYVRPTVDMLKTYINEEDYSTNYEQDIEALEKVLEEFGIPAKVENVRRGAAVTRYELHMPTGIPVRKIQAHSSDIALALAAKSDIRIEAPIKGKSAVGIEVPNNKIDTVGLKDIISSPRFMEAKSPLTFALGKDVDGNVYCCNLVKMPHLLVAGSTGSGKSVCLNALILSLIYRTSPEDLRMILVDPKRVEFGIYNDLPHLLMPKVITEPKKALNAFDWLINEMERRYIAFQSCFVKDINEYNSQPDIVSKKNPKMPYIVLIVDEVADLVITIGKKEFEEKIIRLTQKARAAGIHLILATQRPSVDIITGSIKVNLPSRIAFAVTTFIDSKTILDQGGAEKLLGRGDMLYSPSDSEPVRVQGAFVDTPEVKEVVEFIKTNNLATYDDNIGKTINNENNSSGNKENAFNMNTSHGTDSLMQDALKHVIEVGQASTSMLQRRFSLGFQRAARIIDQMEQAGFISSSDGSKPRTVYMTMDDYNKFYGFK